MPEPTAKEKAAAQKAKANFGTLHDELHLGKEIDYAYQPAHKGEQIRLYLYGNTGNGLVLYPNGTYTIE